MDRARLTPVRTVAALSLVGCIALAGCGGGGSSDNADPQTTTTTKAASSSSVNESTTTTTPSSGSPTNTTGITFKTICDYATGSEMSTATGVSGLTAISKGIPTSDEPAATCTYDNLSSPTNTGVAFLSYDTSDPTSFGRQPDDHGLDGFEMKAPTPDEIAFGQAHPGMGRGVVTISWVHDGYPVHFRMNETAADGAKTIAEAQKINAKLP